MGQWGEAGAGNVPAVGRGGSPPAGGCGGGPLAAVEGALWRRSGAGRCACAAAARFGPGQAP